MAYTTEQIIQARCNSLYSSLSLPIYIDMANQQIDANSFGNKKSLAVALLSMHLFTMDNNINSLGGSGAVSSKSEGGSSISFSTPSNLSDSLNLTGFGQEFLSLRRGTIGRFANTGYNPAITYPVDLI
jgi:hypothetical protein